MYALNAFHVIVQSLSAENVTLETSYGAITGQFSTSTSLTLITSNAPIDVAVDLLHDDKRLPTSLYMYTSNGYYPSHTLTQYLTHFRPNSNFWWNRRVGSTINLKSTSPSQSGGSYAVTAQTSNSPAVLTFPTSPLLSTLYLLSQTSNSPSHITLDKAYEGKFELHTSNGGIGVQHNEKTMDPAGRGRKRNLGILRAGMRYAIGEVYWGNKDGEKGKGNVVARTSNSPIVLELA